MASSNGTLIDASKPEPETRTAFGNIFVELHTSINDLEVDIVTQAHYIGWDSVGRILVIDDQKVFQNITFLRVQLMNGTVCIEFNKPLDLQA